MCYIQMHLLHPNTGGLKWRVQCIRVSMMAEEVLSLLHSGWEVSP